VNKHIVNLLRVYLKACERRVQRDGTLTLIEDRSLFADSSVVSTMGREAVLRLTK
jgi:hypothetical protein